MAFPSGTIYYIPITVNKAKIDSVFSYFAYSIDLSSKLAGDATFKSYISSGANIAVYDPVADSIRPRQVFLDLTNNRLLIYFDSSTSTSVDKVYYVCVGTSISQVSSISALSNSGFIHYWGFNNFEASPTGCADYVGDVGLSIVSQASIAEGKFGPSSVGLGTNGYLRGTYQVPGPTSLMFEFLLNMDPITSVFGVIFQNYPIGCYGWSNAGNTYLLLTYNNGANQIFKIGITPNVWHHVAVIKSGDQWAEIYVDGALYTYGYPGTYSPSSSNFNFLNNDLNALPLKGLVDDFGIKSYDASYTSWIITRYNMFISPATFWTIGSGTYYYHVNADFSAASLSVNVGDNVNFTNLSEGYPAISDYDWDLDDGFSSSDTNPVQSWDIVGPKTISLTATNDYGSDTETKTDYINVWLLAANFTTDTATPFQNQDIQFTDLTEHSGTLLTWDWDFGDGTSHSSEQNPIHSYAAIGYKTVTLIVTSTDGTDSITKANCINVIEFASGFSKITLISSTKNIFIDPPIFGYTTKIRFPFEYVPIECGTFALYDMGVGAASFNMYDKRECICDFELTNQESASLNDFIQSARNETISLVVPPNSGFYPMGPDKGNCGTFSAVIERVKHKGMLNEPFRYFGDQLRFQFTACCSSSLPTQVPDGTFQIGSITDLRFPEDMFDPDHTFAYYPQLTEGSTAKFVDRGSLSDIRLTQFTLRSNTSKAAALVNHIVTTIRTNQTSIIAQPEHYPFGINDGDNQMFDAFMIQDTLSIKHNRFNEFEMQLRFLLEKHISPSSPWFYTTPSEFLSHNNDGVKVWQ